MFQILKNPTFDFMGKKAVWLGLSVGLMALAAVVLSVKGVDRGIDFTGGTELQIKYVTAPDLADIRSKLSDAGLANHVVTTIGKPEENEVYVRLASAADRTEEDLAPRVQRALRDAEIETKRQQGLLDLNAVDEPTLRRLLEVAPGVGSEEAARIASLALEARRDRALLRSPDDLAGAQGVTEPVLEFLRQRTFAGPFAVLSQAYVGPAIGGELIRKAWGAVIGSLGGMLIYIGVRFRSFPWGVAAVAALVHDTLVTAGLFSLFDRELSLPVVAAFLTLMGYSVNDTVVVFDRIRENLRLRGAMGFQELINLSINQTLSRTIISAGLTWITTLALFLYGGEALNSFAFVLTVGIVMGTYSSISVASPLLIFWRSRMERRKTGSAERPADREPEVAPKRSPARKVRPNRS